MVGIIDRLQKQEGPDGISSNIGSTVQYHVGACTVHLLMTTTKIRVTPSSRLLATSTAIYASPCFAVEVLVVVRAGVIKLDVFPPWLGDAQKV